ncbi:MAG: hypothetical protein H6581_22635 [Bacteroidia bacterium]|nr:hypothetical protein [Bacteroidia bacterium]
MKKILIILLITILAFSCQKNSFVEFESHFPQLTGYPLDFIYEAENLPDSISTPFIHGIVRPIGRVDLPEGHIMLVSNNYIGQEAPFGELNGYIFKEGKLISTQKLAVYFPEEIRSSTLIDSQTLEMRSRISDLEADEEPISQNWIMKFQPPQGSWVRVTE